METFLLEEIKKCGVEHPARVLDFEDLVKGLFGEVDKGNVSVGSRSVLLRRCIKLNQRFKRRRSPHRILTDPFIVDTQYLF